MSTSFEKLCDKYFHFLTKCNFKKISTESSPWGAKIKYANGTTGIEITDQVREYDAVLIKIHQLSGGEFRKREDEGWLYLDDFIQLIDPNMAPKERQLYNTSHMDEVLKQYSDVIRNHAKDLIDGDFSIMPAARKIMLHRINANRTTTQGERLADS